MVQQPKITKGEIVKNMKITQGKIIQKNLRQKIYNNLCILTKE